MNSQFRLRRETANRIEARHVAVNSALLRAGTMMLGTSRILEPGGVRATIAKISAAARDLTRSSPLPQSTPHQHRRSFAEAPHRRRAVPALRRSLPHRIRPTL